MSVYPNNVDFIHVSEFMEQNTNICVKKVFFKVCKKVFNTVYGTSVVHVIKFLDYIFFNMMATQSI